MAGPTLRGVELVDVADATAEGYPEGLVWEGLGLLPYCIAPHYKSDHRDSPHIERMVEYYIENKIPFVALRDGEVLVTSR